VNYVVKNIEQIRKRKGITKTHIAKRCGKSVPWYADISKGRRRLFVGDLLSIAEALEEKPEIFFDQELSETRNCDSA